MADNGSTDVPLDTVFELLADRRRRHVLQYLRERDAPAPTAALVEHLAEREAEADADRIAIALHHELLPRLTEESVVVHDPDADAVALGPGAEAFLPYLRLAADRDRE